MCIYLLSLFLNLFLELSLSWNYIMSLANRYAAIIKRTGNSAGHMSGRGITAVIKSNYYPDYVFTKGPPFETAVNASGKKGRSRGLMVDHQVQKWIKGQGAAPHELRGMFEDQGAQPLTFHPFARAFIELTQKLELTPIGTQVVVQDERCNVATLVDAVFLNAKGRVVLVELKTGFEGYNDTSNGDMKTDFAYLTNAPANQHQIQLAFTRCMFEETFQELGEVHAVIVRMTDSGAHVQPLDHRVWQTARAVLRKGRWL